MSKDSYRIGFVVYVIILGLIAGYILGFGCGSLAKRHSIRSDAIRAGVAEWYIADSDSGAVEFRWKGQ